MITVVGSSNTDFSIKTDFLPKEGQTVLGEDISVAAGGKGANQAVQIARLGGRVVFVCRIGNDCFGDDAVAGFKREGIDTRYVLRDNRHPSGTALIVVDKKGKNQIAVAAGSNSFLIPADINKARPAIERSRVLLLQLEIPLGTVRRAIEIASSPSGNSKVITILNPAPAARIESSLLKKIDVIVPNEREAQFLSGVSIRDSASAAKAGRIILKLGVKSVIITLGSKGSVVIDGGGASHIPPPKVKVIDTTAAGDSFCGALAVLISEGKSLIEAAVFASYCASISVTRAGAQPSLPTRKEVIGFIKGYSTFRNRIYYRGVEQLGSSQGS